MTTTVRSSRSLRGDITFAFALALACYVAWLIRSALVLLYVSALVCGRASALGAVHRPLRIGRFQPFQRVSIFILLLAVVGGLIAFGFFALPPVIRDLEEFGKEMPLRLPPILERLRTFPLVSRINLTDLAGRIQDFAGHSATYLLLSLKNWASSLFTIAMGLILTIYFTLEGETAYRWFLSFFPPQSREPAGQDLAAGRGPHGQVADRAGQPDAHPGTDQHRRLLWRFTFATRMRWAC